MQGNDLANTVVPRDVIVWEGLLGILDSPKSVSQATRYQNRGRWEKALACYQTNEMMARKIWDLASRFSVELDVLTFIGHEYAKSLAVRLLENEELPVRKVWHEDPYLLARRLNSGTTIRNIYLPEPSMQFVFGSRGRVLFPGEFSKLGAM